VIDCLVSRGFSIERVLPLGCAARPGLIRNLTSTVAGSLAACVCQLTGGYVNFAPKLLIIARKSLDRVSRAPTPHVELHRARPAVPADVPRIVDLRKVCLPRGTDANHKDNFINYLQPEEGCELAIIDSGDTILSFAEAHLRWPAVALTVHVSARTILANLLSLRLPDDVLRLWHVEAVLPRIVKTEIRAVRTTPDRRGLGLGEISLRTLLKRLSRVTSGATYAWVAGVNSSSLRLFRKCGFRIRGFRLKRNCVELLLTAPIECSRITPKRNGLSV
jgi:GNAT superfamily N-acetyltransferase